MAGRGAPRVRTWSPCDKKSNKFRKTEGLEATQISERSIERCVNVLSYTQQTMNNITHMKLHTIDKSDST